MRFKVSFKEVLTRKTFTKEVAVLVHKNDEPKLQIVGLQKHFKPGFAYKLKTIVTRFYGTLETDRFSPAELSVNFFYKPL